MTTAAMNANNSESTQTRANRAAALLKQASDATRLQILLLLRQKDHNVTELCAELGNQSQPAVSHHLALLYAGSLIQRRRQAKHNFYCLSDRGVRLVLAVEALAK